MLTDLDEVYGDSGENEAPKSETSLPNPTNPYAASKAACEYIVRSYYVSADYKNNGKFWLWVPIFYVV